MSNSYGIGDTGYKFNASDNNNAYVGYMYGTEGSLEKNRTNQINSSTIKQTIDTWYENNLKAKGLDTI